MVRPVNGVCQAIGLAFIKEGQMLGVTVTVRNPIPYISITLYTLITLSANCIAVTISSMFVVSPTCLLSSRLK